MKPIVPTKGGSEEDAFSRRARKLLSFRPGERNYLKRKYNKRTRKTLRLENENEYVDAPELTDEQLAEADLREGDKLIRRGRPPSETGEAI
jgi:hypothetical protein